MGNVMVIPAKRQVGNTARQQDAKPKLRVAAYCRVSTDSDEQATSYDAQVEHYTEFIQKTQNGQVQVNHNHFLGYTKDADGNLIIDPEQAEVVKRIYREYLEGYSMDRIAKGLEADGILTGAGKTKWWTSTINTLLGDKSTYQAQLQQNIAKVIRSAQQNTADGIDERLQELQKELLKRPITKRPTTRLPMRSSSSGNSAKSARLIPPPETHRFPASMNCRILSSNSPHI